MAEKEKTFYGFHLKEGQKERIAAAAALTDRKKSEVITDAIAVELSKYKEEIDAMLKLKRK